MSPNALTVLGLLAAISAGILFGLRQPFVAGISAIAMETFDLLDGSVARASKTYHGSFNDHIADRISDISIFAGIAYANYYLLPPFVVILALGFSLLPSYLIAKTESLGQHRISFGISERADRLAVLAIFSLLGYISLGIWAVLALGAATTCQRYVNFVRARPSS